MTPPAPTEADIVQAFRKRLYYAAPEVKVIGIPNAGRRSRWAAMQARKEGMVAGVPDVVCIWPGGGVCWIEFKTAKGRLSEAQAEWLDLLARYGFPACVARSADEAVDALRLAGAPVREQVA